MKIKGYYLSCYDLDELNEIVLYLEAEGLPDLAEQIYAITKCATPVELEVKNES
jgi:hypothetical protein